jgi:TonB family protein
MSTNIFLLAVVIKAVLIPAIETTTVTAQEVRIGNVPTIPTSGVTPPKLASYTRPAYTDEARRRSIEGVVTVEASFDGDGNFKVLRIVKGLGHGLDESALAALKNWRFTPAYRNGQKVGVVAQIDVNFTLFDDPQWVYENIRKPEERTFRIETIRSTVEQWPND